LNLFLRLEQVPHERRFAVVVDVDVVAVDIDVVDVDIEI